MDMIIEQLCGAPETEVSDNVRELVVKFRSEAHTPSEKFDFINGVSKKAPFKRTWYGKDRGEVSSFVIKLCELERYYIRPN